jgi:hypothetical protein
VGIFRRRGNGRTIPMHEPGFELGLLQRAVFVLAESS